jgi:hypothetical protein
MGTPLESFSTSKPPAPGEKCTAANQTCGRGIHPYWMATMLRASRLSKNGDRLVSFRAEVLCLAIFALLLARIAAPHFPPTFFQTAVRSSADPDHIQFLDHDNSEWVSSATVSHLKPPLLMSPHLTSSPDPVIEFLADGFQYDRPPPIS